MDLSWNLPGTIRPVWHPEIAAELHFPSAKQKNRKKQRIPLCPWLESQLLDVPPGARVGYVFSPVSLQEKIGRRYRGQRLKTEQVGKVISRIGKKAGIVVEEENPRTKAPAKFASAHDLRRTFARRLRESNLPPNLIQSLMRHSDIRTTERYYFGDTTQAEAQQIRSLLRSEPTSETRSPVSIE